MGEIRSLERLHGPNIPLDYCVVDTETSGFDPSTNKIVEIAAVKVRNGRIVDEFSTLVKNKTTKKASEVNGITQDMLKTAPSQDDAIQAFSEFVGSDVLVAHNARFDKSFLDAACYLKNEWIDTLAVARMFTPDERNRLQDLCVRFGVANECGHRALSDCRALNECWLKLRQQMLDTSTDARDFERRTDVEPANDGVYGKGFVFTGGSDTSLRHDFMHCAWKRGAVIQNGVSRKTDYLVVIDEQYRNGSKAKKAKELADSGSKDVAIIGVDEFVLLVPEAAASVSKEKAIAAAVREFVSKILGGVDEDDDLTDKPGEQSEEPTVDASAVVDSGKKDSAPQKRKKSGFVRLVATLAKWTMLAGMVVWGAMTVSFVLDGLSAAIMSACVFLVHTFSWNSLRRWLRK